MPQAVKEQETSPEASPGQATKTILVSELDSYIHERAASQPKTLEEVAVRIERVSSTASLRHRLVLPEFFEQESYDCTWMVECPYHANGFRGRFVFRWEFKEKRALDRALNVIGWTIATHTLFPSAPQELFTANGAVENGDALLMFIPFKKALELRAAPGRKSREMIARRMTLVDPDPENPYVLMTDNPKDRRYYKPDLPPESVESEEDATPGVLVEGKQFK